MNLKTRLAESKIVLHEEFYDHVKRYSDHLMAWNKIHNLTGSKNALDVEENIFDSLFPLSFLPQVNKALDIGTGAGFPGMILAMALRHTHFVLAEPLHKRAGFLHFIKSDLGLDNVTVFNHRVENLKDGGFDLITSRAVTSTQMLLSLSEPFATEKTLYLFYKGERVLQEVDKIEDYSIVTQGKRKYLLIQKAQA